MKASDPLFVKSLFLFLLLAASPAVYAQEPEAETANFQWEIKFVKNRIMIECLEGCAFTNLTFSSNRSVTLNQAGMVDLEKNPSEGGNSQFLIAYAKEGKKMTLTGIKGVAWTELTFTAGKAVYGVDENGMIPHP